MPSEDAARNLAPRNGAFWVYLAAVGAAGIVLITVTLMGLTAHDFRLMGGSFIAVAALLVLCELRPLVTAGSPDANGVSVSTAFVFALLIHWGLGVALLMQTIATILADAVRQKVVWRTSFNVGQQALSFGAAAAVLWVFGQHATTTNPMSVDGPQLPGLVIAGIVYFFVNNALVSEALALRNRSGFRAEFFSNWAYQVGANGALLGL